MMAMMSMTDKPTTAAPHNWTAIIVVATVLFGAFCYVTLGPVGKVNVAQRSDDPSLILSGLPADSGQANVTFRARVISEFPLLTPEYKLMQTLSRQGFVSDGWFSNKRMTFRRDKWRGCNYTASVTWESDDQARIRTLDARFLATSDCF
jgi:hypothetical protein